MNFPHTLLSPASAHWHSQLKHQKLRVGRYTENVLTCKWFNYPHPRAHPGCEVSCHGTCIVSSSVICRGQPNSGESCIMLQSRPAHSLDAKFPQHSVVACSTRISCCRVRMLRTRPRTGVCEPLMLWRPKSIRTIAATYVSSADLPSDS